MKIAAQTIAVTDECWLCVQIALQNSPD